VAGALSDQDLLSKRNVALQLENLRSHSMVRLREAQSKLTLHGIWFNIRSADLSRFQAIVIGIRAYNTRDVLRSQHDRLMGYVEAGGTVVVQYNTQSRLGPLESRVGPYPLEIGRGRVTEERAAMTVLAPGHELLAKPNRIESQDFDGWIQERGLYYASTWDDKYTPIFAANDEGEDPLKGGLLFTRHGKGRYVFTGLAFFRQLPAGVPGAYRLFLNLIGSGR
jgi:hypothetical protein